MTVRCFEVDGESYYAVVDILVVLGYTKAEQIKGRQIVLDGVPAGYITSVPNGVIGRGTRKVQAVTRAGLDIILECYPQLADYME